MFRGPLMRWLETSAGMAQVWLGLDGVQAHAVRVATIEDGHCGMLPAFDDLDVPRDDSPTDWDRPLSRSTSEAVAITAADNPHREEIDAILRAKWVMRLVLGGDGEPRLRPYESGEYAMLAEAGMPADTAILAALQQRRCPANLLAAAQAFEAGWLRQWDLA